MVLPTASPARRMLPKWRMKREYIAPILGVCCFFIVIIVLLSGGMGHEKATAYALVGGATIAWIDTRALSLEVTSILVLMVPVISGNLTFSQAMAGASGSSIWLIWVGSVAGAALDRCQVSDWLVRIISHGMDERPSLQNLLGRVALLTFVASIAIPSAVVRNLMLVPLGARLREARKLSAVRAEAITALLIFGATKPGLGLLTGYVTAMLVAGVYAGALESPAGGQPAPSTLSWAGYAGAMLPIWGVLIMPVLLLSVYAIYRPLEKRAQRIALMRLQKVFVEVRDGVAKSRRAQWRRRFVDLTTPPAERSSDETERSTEGEGGSEVDGFEKRSSSLHSLTFRRSMKQLADHGVDPLHTTPAQLRASTQMGPPSIGTSSSPQSSNAQHELPKLSTAGKRAMLYLALAICGWALLGGTFSVSVDRGAVGLGLVVLLYAPPPIGVADPAELRHSKSYGVIIYLVSVIALNTTISAAGITADLADSLGSSLAIDTLPTVLQYCLVSWSIAALTVPTNEVLACVLGTSIWLQFVTRASYVGPLTPVRVALACAAPGALCLTPTHCPPVVVGLAMAKASPGGMPVQPGRLYAMLAMQTAAEVLILVPLSALVIAHYG